MRIDPAVPPCFLGSGTRHRALPVTEFLREKLRLILDQPTSLTWRQNVASLCPWTHAACFRLMGPTTGWGYFRLMGPSEVPTRDRMLESGWRSMAGGWTPRRVQSVWFCCFHVSTCSPAQKRWQRWQEKAFIFTGFTKRLRWCLYELFFADRQASRLSMYRTRSPSFWGGSPTKIDYRKKGYPYPILCTGGPRGFVL